MSCPQAGWRRVNHLGLFRIALSGSRDRILRHEVETEPRHIPSQLPGPRHPIGGVTASQTHNCSGRRGYLEINLMSISPLNISAGTTILPSRRGSTVTPLMSA